MRELESGSISISYDALARGTAVYRYVQVDGPADEFQVDGIVAMHLPQGSELPEDFFGSLCLSSISCDINVGLTIPVGATALVGSISLQTAFDTLWMSGSSVWSGRFSSDFRSYGGDFTGTWSLVEIIPEPGMLQLVVFACSLLILAGWRRRARIDREA